MDYLKPNDLAKRNDNGQVIRIVEVRPIGLRVFYMTEGDDGNTAFIGHDQLRPFAAFRRRSSINKLDFEQIT
jgi:hypothetical protein